MTRRSPLFVARRVARRFVAGSGVDAGAALTFYSILSLLPALVVLVSLVGLAGRASETVGVIERVAARLFSPETAAEVADVLGDVSRYDGSTSTLLVGLAGLLWTASAYVNAFGRAMNRVYEVEEGRPWWRLRPLQVLVTLATLLLTAAGVVVVAVTGPVADVVGGALGVGDDLVTAWEVAKWPVLGLLVMVVVAMLYHLTPNVHFGRVRLVTVGSCSAILVWLAVSVGFGLYVATLGDYNRTYGALAGAVVLALWLWLTNMTLVLGAVLDAELERGRQLQRGLPAESQLQLQVRQDSAATKRREREERDVARMRQQREQAAS